MSNHITPTVGRNVLYRGKDNVVRAAIVAAVHGQFCVNLFVFGSSADDEDCGYKTSVTHGDIEHEPGCFPSWSWMPYQKGQAAKTEQLEAKLGDAHQKPSLAYCQQTGSLCNAEDLAIEKEIKAKGLIYPRVEVGHIDELMKKVRYDCHIVDGTTTTVITAILPITDHINFTVATEIMACVDPRNFNKELGEKHGITKAANAARNKLWELEGYYLARQLEQDMALDAAIASGELEIVSVEALSPHNTINS